MKLLLTSWGPWKNKRLEETFLNLLDKPPKDSTLFILSIDTTSEFHIQHLTTATNWYKKMGFQEENIEVFNLKNDTIPEFHDLDVMHMWGGNNYHYLQILRERELEPKIREFISRNGVYVGGSAGSNIMCPEVDEKLSNDPNDIGVSDVRGFGLVDFYTIPHWDTYHGDKRTRQIQYGWESGKQVIPLTDEQAVLVVDGEFKIISP
jgi:dipeptidase E